MNELAEMAREIQNLQRKILYLSVVVISLTFGWITSSFTLTRSYSNIMDYYHQTVEQNQELQELLETRIRVEGDLLNFLRDLP